MARAEGDSEVLLARARLGDAQAYGELVLEHQARVRRQLRRLTRGDHALADDLAQDCFVQAWREIARFRGEARLATWLHRIAYHRFLSHQRSARPARADLPGTVAQEFAATDRSFCYPDDSRDQRDAPQAMQIDVARAVARLPDAERSAIIHCYQLDLTHEEAAAVLDTPLGTLKSQVARAKERLREWLIDWQTEKST